MSTLQSLYIGLISGTSIDAIDAALVDFSQPQPKLLQTHSHKIPSQLRENIATLCTPTTSINEIDLLGETDSALGELFAEATLTLLKKANTPAHNITAIGSHGQTVRHRPAGMHPFTLQIADPNIIAQRAGITTVADFRRRDMANGGQGAPFAPAFHQAIAPDNIERCAFLNLGGIANITVIEQGKLICGYDTGPANGLMDAWINKSQQRPYDKNGDWAASGTANEELLQRLLDEPYFALPAPKSTGREYFNLDWLSDRANELLQALPPENIQATLLALTTTTIANAVATHQPQAIYCCGGGVHNRALISSLDNHPALANTQLFDTSTLGIPPDWIEAAAFAWLAKQHMQGIAIDLGSVTGARKPSVLGLRTG